jgi:hypothetical protein
VSSGLRAGGLRKTSGVETGGDVAVPRLDDELVGSILKLTSWPEADRCPNMSWDAMTAQHIHVAS